MPNILTAILLFGSFAAGIGSLGLAWYLNRYRGSPGAGWFMLALCAQAVWTIGYGTGLLLFDPGLRAAAETVVWISSGWLGPLFLGFVLKYTGRNDLFRSRWFQAVFLVPVGGSLLFLTNPFHGLMWQQFRIEPLFGLATALYAIQPAAYLVSAVSLGTAAIGVLLLVETILTYGPLYRQEAIAVALSTLPPAAAMLVWLFGVGPWPALNLAPVMFLLHIALDGYAFVGTHMFDTNPTTQRAAEQRALNRLDSPLLVVDPYERVVNLNDRAEELFEHSDRSSLLIDVESLVGVDLATLRERGEYEPDREDRVFSVRYHSLTDPRGELVGGFVSFYDITAERRQRQRLGVLNRVLRHNLRNEMNIIQGQGTMIEQTSEDPQIESQADSILGASQRLLSISSKARDFDRLSSRSPRIDNVDLSATLREVVADLRSAYPGAIIETDCDVCATQFRTDREFVSVILSNVIENAIVHDPEDTPVVRARVRTVGDRAVFVVGDTNPEIAGAELDPIRADEETALHHGSGIGLWIVNWCVRALNGEVEFDYHNGNIVTITLP